MFYQNSGNYSYIKEAYLIASSVCVFVLLLIFLFALAKFAMPYLYSKQISPPPYMFIQYMGKHEQMNKN